MALILIFVKQFMRNPAFPIPGVASGSGVGAGVP
jgi:hypothetical protein